MVFDSLDTEYQIFLGGRRTKNERKRPPGVRIVARTRAHGGQPFRSDKFMLRAGRNLISRERKQVAAAYGHNNYFVRREMQVIPVKRLCSEVFHVVLETPVPLKPYGVGSHPNF